MMLMHEVRQIIRQVHIGIDLGIDSGFQFVFFILIKFAANIQFTGQHYREQEMGL